MGAVEPDMAVGEDGRVYMVLHKAASQAPAPTPGPVRSKAPPPTLQHDLAVREQKEREKEEQRRVLCQNLEQVQQRHPQQALPPVLKAAPTVPQQGTAQPKASIPKAEVCGGSFGASAQSSAQGQASAAPSGTQGVPDPQAVPEGTGQAPPDQARTPSVPRVSGPPGAQRFDIATPRSESHESPVEAPPTGGAQAAQASRNWYDLSQEELGQAFVAGDPSSSAAGPQSQSPKSAAASAAVVVESQSAAAQAAAEEEAEESVAVQAALEAALAEASQAAESSPLATASQAPPSLGTSPPGPSGSRPFRSRWGRGGGHLLPLGSPPGEPRGGKGGEGGAQAQAGRCPHGARWGPARQGSPR